MIIYPLIILNCISIIYLNVFGFVVLLSGLNSKRCKTRNVFFFWPSHSRFLSHLPFPSFNISGRSIHFQELGFQLNFNLKVQSYTQWKTSPPLQLGSCSSLVSLHWGRSGELDCSSVCDLYFYFSITWCFWVSLSFLVNISDPHPEHARQSSELFYQIDFGALV